MELMLDIMETYLFQEYFESTIKNSIIMILLIILSFLLLKRKQNLKRPN